MRALYNPLLNPLLEPKHFFQNFCSAPLVFSILYTCVQRSNCGQACNHPGRLSRPQDVLKLFKEFMSYHCFISSWATCCTINFFFFVITVWIEIIVLHPFLCKPKSSNDTRSSISTHHLVGVLCNIVFITWMSNYCLPSSDMITWTIGN